MTTRRRKVEVQITDTKKGTGFKETERDARRLGDSLGKEGKRGGDRFGDEADKSVHEKFRKIGRDLPKFFGRALTVGMKPIAVAAAVGFAAQFATSLGSALSSGIQLTGSAGLAGVLIAPSAALAAGLALGTVKVALSGISDAFKAGLTGDAEEFKEAIAGLAPSARRFMREVRSLRGDLKDLRTQVQGNFFRPLVDNVRPLAERYLPVLRTNMALLARSMGEAASRSAGFLAEPRTAMRLAFALGNARVMMTQLVGATGNLVRAFVPIIAVGSEYLPRLTDGASAATARFARFVREAEKTGRIRAWIENGISSLRQLRDGASQIGRIFRNVGSIVATVFGAAGIQGSATGALDAVERLTGRVDRFLQSSRGAEILQTVFSGIRSSIEGIREPLERAFTILAETVTPLLPDVAGLVMAFGDFRNAVLNVGIDVLEPAVRGLGAALGVLIPILSGVLGWLSRHEGVIRGIGIVIAAVLLPNLAAWTVAQTRAGVKAAWLGVKAHWATTKMVAGWVKAGAVATVNAAKVVAGWVASGAKALWAARQHVIAFAKVVAGWVRAGVVALANGAKVAAGWALSAAGAVRAGVTALAQFAIQGARWVWLGITALASGAKIAAAWLISIGPLLLVAAAVAGFVALVVIHWDTIRSATAAVFRFVVDTVRGAIDWVRTNWPLLLAILTGPFGLAVWFIAKHWQTIKDGALAAKDWVVTKFGELVDWAKGLPGKLADAASGLWDWVTAGLSNAVRWVWDHIRSLIRAYNSIPMLPDVPVPGQQKQFGGVLPKSHSGELIPGGPSVEVPRLLQGGEEVLARDDPRNVRNLGSFTPALAAAGGGGGVSVHIDLRGSTISNEADAERMLVQAWNRAVQKGGARLRQPRNWGR